MGDALGARHLPGTDLELLDPGDDNELTFLIEARHAEFEDALGRGGDVIVDGEPVSPRLDVAMHQVVASQLLADDPPATWQTVQRLIGLGYDWHNIMHMIAALLAEEVYRVMQEHRRLILATMPAGWTSCPATGRRRSRPGGVDSPRATIHGAAWPARQLIIRGDRRGKSPAPGPPEHPVRCGTDSHANRPGLARTTAGVCASFKSKVRRSDHAA